MPELAVPNAILHYETFGTKGPLLLLIPGADGRGSIFHTVSQSLSASFTVVCWDRRGYSQSFLVGQQDFEHRLQTDADDAQRLIAHLSHDGTAMVFGTSSGALVAQQLLASHPDCVAKLVSHEPPAFSILPEQFRAQAVELVDQVYDTYRAHGPDAGMVALTSALAGGSDAKMMRDSVDPRGGDEIRANSLFWFEFEMRQYGGAAVDVEGLGKAKDKLILVAGKDTGDGPGAGPVSAIAGQLGKEVLRISGGHLGFKVAPEVFAKELLELLSM